MLALQVLQHELITTHFLILCRVTICLLTAECCPAVMFPLGRNKSGDYV